MALLEATPKIVRHEKTRVYTNFSREFYLTGTNGCGTYYRTYTDYYKDLEEIEYVWKCDDADDNTTHEATYGTGGWVLRDHGFKVQHARKTGEYREVYVKIDSIWYPGTSTFTI